MAEGKFGRLGRLWQHAGLFCVMVEPYHGRRTGYVRIPEGHPWHGLDSDAAVPQPGESPYLGRPASEVPFGGMVAVLFGGVDDWLSKLDAQVEVHGGLTMSGDRTAAEWDATLDDGDGIPAGWWIGFDCGHAGDASDPSIMDEANRGIYEKHLRRLDRDAHIWTADEVIAETNRLAEQVAAAGRVPSGVGGSDG